MKKWRNLLIAMTVMAGCASAVGDDDLDPDIAKVQQWAMMGDMQAQNMLALSYLNGDFGYHSEAEARQWLTRAAEQGHPGAQTNLALLYLGEASDQRLRSALDLLYSAAEQKFSSAQLMLGSLYEAGRGVPKNYRKAAEWYQAAARQGNAAAQYHLALLLSEGQGVAQDQQQASYWLKQAAAQDLSAAQFQLGQRYLYGVDGETDLLQGYQYLLKASMNVSRKSLDSRDLVSTGITAEQIAGIQDETRNWQGRL